MQQGRGRGNTPASLSYFLPGACPAPRVSGRILQPWKHELCSCCRNGHPDLASISLTPSAEAAPVARRIRLMGEQPLLGRLLSSPSGVVRGTVGTANTYVLLAAFQTFF